MAEILTTAGLISLFTLTCLEIILGIDNIIFISIVANKLPPHQRDKARNVGIILALVVRILLLLGITWIIGLQEPIFSISFFETIHVDPDFSGRDLILLGGGLFLMAKSIAEIHDKIEGHEEKTTKVFTASMAKTIFQIVIIDIVFSFDSILTAVGLVKNVTIMITAVIISLSIMLFAAKSIGDFVERHPTLKMLALSFLVLIGFLLVIEGFGEHVPKGYIYFAMAFAFIVELLNMKTRKNTIKQELLQGAEVEEKN
ncbi:TerC family protein [Flexithrix dorotheae]|uniref:TerC family protein n=1 Tax=Flexithrix dorotheae TaxID=70993 RepID=UPI000374CD0F|nr:TerC family protein [Flexithrix dorotheae]